ncbi:MAG: UDP-N-acetylglucosamine 2-epimerase [Nitrosotalea sp.]
MKRKILVITERRADYTKLRPILFEISKSKKLEYYLIVTGTHLLKEFGHTIDEIKNDGFKIMTTFPMHGKKRQDTGAEMSRAFGRAIMHLSSLIEKIKPDVILTGFDIGANFAASIAGSHMNIVVAHVEGGEVTGTIDESIRHATTKFAHLHFTSNADATQRLIKMGEDPRYIFTVGNTSLDGIRKIKTIEKNMLEKKYGIDFSKPFLIVLQHTVTSEVAKGKENILKTIQAIKELGLQAIFIYGNADAGSQQIMKEIKNSNLKQYATVPFNEYINLLKHSSALVGNSSSGIIECPFLKIPTVNIGTRQNGRIRAKSIIDVNYDKEKIKKAIKKAVYDKNFLRTIGHSQSFYGDGFSARKIIKILESINLKKIPIQKKLTY